MELSLADLVQNRTMSPEIAATLAVAAEERRSMVFVALPRLAGKTTTMMATLKHVPSGTVMHRISRAAGASLGIPREPDGGYLLVSEISPAGFDEYLWGAHVRQVFNAASSGGYSLATALHAEGVDEAFNVITVENGVPDEQASCIDLVVYIRSLGYWAHPERRAVAGVYEINGVAAGRPDARLLHRWDERSDSFEEVASPLRVGKVAATYARYVEDFSHAAVG